MEYVLLAYGKSASAPEPMHDAIAALLARPYVTGWARLHADEAATTLRNDEGRTLLTDGPFIESKEYLVGLIMIEADNLDRALAIARGAAGRDDRRRRVGSAAGFRKSVPWPLRRYSVITGVECWRL